MSDARARILARLRAIERPEGEALARPVSRHDWSREERLQRFTERMTEVRAEVIHTDRDKWTDALLKSLQAKGADNLLYDAAGPEAEHLRETLGAQGLELLPCDREVEQWKPQLFESVDAAFTGCRGAIAETGSLILWPDANEPRLVSLVPPIHYVLLSAERIYSTFAEAVQAQGWADGMPTNALLVSGPSKSADIAQVLAYGVHGPKSLVVLVVDR
ncbi:MAG: lactate utilization protein C [Candidatus Thiodiazotropha sp.]